MDDCCSTAFSVRLPPADGYCACSSAWYRDAALETKSSIWKLASDSDCFFETLFLESNAQTADLKVAACDVHFCMAKVEKASDAIFCVFASVAASLMQVLKVLRAPSAAAD